MRDRDLYQTILGIVEPWSVTDVDLKSDERKVEVFVSRSASAEARCPECQAVSPRYDKRVRRWRHLDTCQFQTILVAEVPRVTCTEHGVKQIDVPWAEERSRFTALFEMLVIDWLREASVSAVCRQLDLGWDAVDGIMQRAVKRGLARRDDIGLYPDLDVDETAFRKRHDYVTVVSDPGTGAVIHLCDDRKKSSLTAFYKGLSDEQRAGIRTVSMDMWPAFINATLESIPEAESKIAFDRFHVAQHLGNAVDKVRRDEHKKLKRDGNTILNGTKHDWLRAGNNVPKKRRGSFRALCDSTLKTARAWAWKESAACLWHYRSRTWATKAWERWYRGAIRSRLEPIKRAARMIKRHLWGIVNAIVTGTTNAGAESINSRIKMVKVRSRGFRNKERFKTAIYFHLGGLDLYPETAAR